MVSDDTNDNAERPLPLVVIGASAGGLEPLEVFFESVPLDLGWCFVVVQHLSPDYKSMMHELLSRKSPLKIRHIDDGQKLEKNTIFLNRPSTLVMLEGDVFRTQSYENSIGTRNLPIDAILSSLAGRDPTRTAGVILSGSGTDGTRGAESMHAAGGLILVQSLSEAAFPSMPRSALTNEVADRVLPARDIPKALEEYFRLGNRKLEGSYGDAVTGPKSILRLLEDAHGIDFTDYKPHNVQRRIERRQHLQGYETTDEYRDALSKSPAALEELYHDLLIGVTEFYRDEETMQALRQKVLDILAADPEEKAPIRIWVPACSSGEEAYTIAIELCEALAQAGRKRSFRIIATDVHRRSIDVASAGIYSAEAVERVPEPIREKYFERVRDRYGVTPALRQKLIFSVHDVLSDPPFMNLDLISCRNLLIYLTESAQARLISMFLFGLRTGGFLLLGSSESLGRFTSEFRNIESRYRLFQKATNKRGLDRTLLSSKMGSGQRREASFRGHPTPLRFSAPREMSEFRNRESLVRCYDALLKRYAPSSILVSEQGAVLAWFGAASVFIDTMNNLAEWTVEEIVHPDLHFAINVAAEKLRQEQLESYARSVTVRFSEGVETKCEIRIEPLQEVQGNRLMLVTLALEGDEDETTLEQEAASIELTGSDDTRILSKRVVELERDLRLTEETLQHVTERLEASGEELQASNEELQASNEELQASNEELQSSNEELHAVNEELVSVSSEHEQQIDNLSELNRNIELVLKTLAVGIISVDTNIRVRRFSHLIAKRFEFESHDIMRSLSVIGPRIEFFDLPKAVSEVLETGELSDCKGDHQGEELKVSVHAITKENEREEKEITGAVIIFQWPAG